MNEKVEKTTKKLEDYIFSLRNEKGVWDGYLSSSALAVAVASFALWKYNPEKNKELIDNGLNWLKENINEDGGYGDTTKSKSNLSTSLLCWSALSIVKDNADYQLAIQKLELWIGQQLGTLEPEKMSKAILNHYREDKTFSVPILAMCALSGRLGEKGWKMVPQLPYQFAALPHRFFRMLNLSVVSYAIPALISMGLVKQEMNPSWNPLMRLVNKLIKQKVLKVLREKQPPNGGFLEAIPLTGFVLMTLVGADLKDYPVCENAEKFLQNSIREDGSWPIDTSLTTWVTTLVVNNLEDSSLDNIDKGKRNQILTWLLNQQHKITHPFTKSAPGGWAWIDTPGGVADGDDTSGALIALKKLAGVNNQSIEAAEKALNWLMGIQNNDGGLPTFCRGWGKLPFDASCPDISAHALRAFSIWKDDISENLKKKLNKSSLAIINYLKKTQQTDGSWFPLWFGNEYDKNHQNPVYGAAQVLIGLCNAQKKGIEGLDQMIEQGAAFLLNVQNADGSWGGNKNLPATVEETSLAIKALCLSEHKEKLAKSIDWLIYKIENDELDSSPIGLYFASLWYDEKMYPLVFGLGALNAFAE